MDDQKYIESMLTLDPKCDAFQIVAQRMARYAPQSQHSRPAEPTADRESVMRSRRQNEAKLTKIRSQIWDISFEELQAKLQQIDVQLNPDLQGQISRLSQAAQVRNDLHQLAQRKDVSQELLTAIRNVLILPHRDSVAQKEAARSALRNAKDFYRIKNTLRLIRKNHKDLYAIESTWFDELLKVEHPLESTLWVGGIVLAVVIIVSLLAFFTERE